MPRANVGTLLENIVLVEVANSLVQRTSEGVIDFINSFVMPPISEWRVKRSDYGLDSSSLGSLLQLEISGTDFLSLMALCTRFCSSGGPNGALLFNLFLRLTNRCGRYWLNDLPDEEMRYRGESFSLDALNEVAVKILNSAGFLCNIKSEIATNRHPFPKSLDHLVTTLRNWEKNPPVARMGYLDSDQYAVNERSLESPQTDSDSVRKFLSLMRSNFEGPIASVHFTTNKMQSVREAQIEGLKKDGAANGYDAYVFEHCRYAVVVHYRLCDEDFADRVQNAWNRWSIHTLGKRRPYVLRIYK